jgi:hypothetical protein
MEVFATTLMPIEQLMEAPWNYKRDDDEKMGRFRASIEKNGFLYPLVVAAIEEIGVDDGQREVCDGNHRLRALRELGLKTVPVLDMGPKPLAERQRIAIELNEWRFQTDLIALAECFREMGELEGLELTSPYDEKELAAIKNLLAFDWAAEEQIALAKLEDKTGEGEWEATVENSDRASELAAALPAALKRVCSDLGIPPGLWRVVYVMVEERGD